MPKERNKIYSLHAPEVVCISKGKARNPYEFRCKVGIAATNREGLVQAAKAFEGNPYDGYTLAATVDQAVEIGSVDPDASTSTRAIAATTMPARTGDDRRPQAWPDGHHVSGTENGERPSRHHRSQHEDRRPTGPQLPSSAKLAMRSMRSRRAGQNLRLILTVLADGVRQFASVLVI